MKNGFGVKKNVLGLFKTTFLRYFASFFAFDATYGIKKLSKRLWLQFLSYFPF